MARIDRFGVFCWLGILFFNIFRISEDLLTLPVSKQKMKGKKKRNKKKP